MSENIYETPSGGEWLVWLVGALERPKFKDLGKKRTNEFMGEGTRCAAFSIPCRHPTMSTQCRGDTQQPSE